MTQTQLQSWIDLQMVGIELLDAHWPVTAAFVRLQVELGKAEFVGLATNGDYCYFDRWHTSVHSKAADLPAWMRRTGRTA